MKVALLHDYLNQYGGGERVLETLMEMFPDAPIYTLMYDEAATRGRFRGRVRGTSFLDFPFARQHHRMFIPLMPLAARMMTIDNDYDLIISDSAGFAKGIARTYADKTRTNADKRPIRHISYIHTPLRYAWETHYITSKFKMQNAKVMSWFLKPALSYLKCWDYNAAQRPDVLIANSKFIAEKIRRYYGREASVVYPPVDTSKFFYTSNPQPPTSNNYYLAVGRLLHYKRFDLVIDAFAKLGLPLKIVGEGPELRKLKVESLKLKVNTKFIPFVEDEDELRKLYAGARAVIFPQTEDFGLVAAEALACGTPVIAYNAGGAREIVEDGSTSLTTSGIFFHEQTAEALAEAVRKFETMKFNHETIARRAAERFGKERFVKEFMRVVESPTTRTITNDTNMI